MAVTGHPDRLTDQLEALRLETARVAIARAMTRIDQWRSLDTTHLPRSRLYLPLADELRLALETIRPMLEIHGGEAGR